MLIAKEIKFAVFCCKMQEFVVVGQIREFCKSCNDRKEFRALQM